MRRYPSKRRARVPYRPSAEEHRQAGAIDAATARFPLPAFIPAPDPASLEAAPSSASKRRWPVKKIALIGTPLLVLAVVAVLIVPTLLAAHDAYNKIFVGRMPHLHVVLNAQGTPVIAETTQTATEPADVSGPGGTTTPDTTAVAVAGTATPEPGSDLPTWDGTSRVTILLLGSDTRGGNEVARSDTLILVTINPQTKQVSMLSIPRDLLVTIPNYGKDKINAAYAYGSTTDLTGPGLAAATIEFNFGVTIDYYAEVDTFGLAKIIDTLGGVTMDVSAPIKDDEYPGTGNNYIRVLFHTGLQHMDGVTAVEFARTRHDDDDFGRGDRQRQLLEALQAQDAKLNLLPKAPQLLSQLGDTVRTDLSPSQVLALAKLGTSINSSSIHSYDLLNATTVSYAPGEPYYLIPNWTAIHKILNDMMSW